MTCSYLVQRAHRGEQPYWMVIALSAMLGQVGLPDGGAFGHGLMKWRGSGIFIRSVVRQRSHDVEWPDFETFWQQGYVDLPAPAKEFVFFDSFREDPQANPLQTPSGKIEFFSERIASYQYNDFAPHAEWKPPVEWLGAPLAEQWPLHLISIQPGDRLHSQLDLAPLAQSNKTAGRETLYMHPRDAASRDITEGSQVQVSNLRGHCLAGVSITDGVTRGGGIDGNRSLV